MSEEERLAFDIQEIIERNFDDHEKTIELVRHVMLANPFTDRECLDFLIIAACKIASGQSAAINNMSLNYRSEE